MTPIAQDAIQPKHASTLLNTKFMAPRQAIHALPRPHLVQRLERNLDRRLILISAPPGYGKTTLLAELVAAADLHSAWYQLDESDSDPFVFLSYLIESLHRIHASIDGPPGVSLGAAAVSLLQNADAGQPDAPRRVLTVLINELAEVIREDWHLILDDYHLVVNPAVHGLVDYLLDNGPPGLHLLISTRVDPPLALARLRARGQLTEIRAPDLRFSDKEVQAWLARDAPDLSAEDARLLSARTEGWAATLRIALSSLAGKSPRQAEAFIAQLSGAHRHIFEYLSEEVFSRQSPARQRFLTHTAVLEQMNAPVCNALLGGDDAQAMLEGLEQDNVFVVSLDDNRAWFRYHLLFRDFLLGKLRRDAPGRLAALSVKAADFYRRQGELEAALTHYLRGGAYAQAADVLVALAPVYIERGRVDALQRYLNELPDPVLRANPLLLVYRGDALTRRGQAGVAIGCYDEALALLEADVDRSGMCLVETRLAEIARSQGDYRRAQVLADQALAWAPDDDHVARARALITLAKSEGFLTGMDRGRALAEAAMDEVRQAGEAIPARTRAGLLCSLGQICWWHGDPQASVRYSRAALESAPDPLSPIAAEAYIIMATPYLYWRNLDAALHCAERGLEIAQALQLQELLPSAYAILGNVLTRRGEMARAESCLRQSVDLAQGLGLETYAQVMATGFLAFNLHRQGRTDEARQQAESALWSRAANPHTYEMYVCRSVLADIALESGQLEQAEALYASLLEVGRRRQFRIPLGMVYFGLAYIALEQGDRARGVEMGRESLRLLEPTGALQLYLDQGPMAGVVCQALLDAGVRSPWVTQVIEHQGDRTGSSVAVQEKQTAVEVACLGQFRVVVDGREVTQERWVSAKARDLLAYFVTFRHERIPAERALEAVWAGRTGRGKTAFHTALSRLRSALRTEGQSAKFILVETGEYWFDAARFHVDVDDFDALLAKARVVPAEEAAPLYEQALALYQGEYLSNLPYAEWAMAERRRLAQAHLDALRALAGHKASAGDPAGAYELLSQVLVADPLDEGSACEAMRHLAAQGKRGEVLRLYEQLAARLDEELGVEPLASTRSLVAGLLGG